MLGSAELFFMSGSAETSCASWGRPMSSALLGLTVNKIGMQSQWR